MKDGDIAKAARVTSMRRRHLQIAMQGWGPAKLAVRPNALTLEPATGAAFPAKFFIRPTLARTSNTK